MNMEFGVADTVAQLPETGAWLLFTGSTSLVTVTPERLHVEVALSIDGVRERIQDYHKRGINSYKVFRVEPVKVHVSTVVMLDGRV